VLFSSLLASSQCGPNGCHSLFRLAQHCASKLLAGWSTAVNTVTIFILIDVHQSAK
jgi:hypothetical protein